MAVKLRLARFGKKGYPVYRLVAIDEHKKRQGRAVEILGQYNPHTKVKSPPAGEAGQKLKVKSDRLAYWLSVGAQPTKTVSDLLKKLK